MAIRQPYVDVRLGNVRHQTISGLYQYDHGLKLRIYELEEPPANVRVQYSFEGLKEATTVVPSLEDDVLTADVPDIMLVQPKPVQCYIYVRSSTSGITVYQIDFPLIPRPEPADAYTPRQINYFVNIEQQLEDLFAESTTLKAGLDELTDAATSAASDARTAATDVSAATTRANAAAAAAEAGASNVNTAVQNATDAAQAANSAADRVDAAIADAEDAADLANEKAGSANSAAAAANAAATSAATAATAANTAATNAGAALHYVGTAYSSANKYSAGDYAIYNGKYYVCTENIDTPEAWNADHWEETTVSDEVTGQRERILELAEIITERTGISCYYGNTAPTEDLLPGDLYIDSGNGNRLKRFNGTNWVDVSDERIAEALQKVGQVKLSTQGTAIPPDVAGVVELQVDAIPTNSSTNLVSSGGVFSELSNVRSELGTTVKSIGQNRPVNGAMSVDTSPIENSTKMVESGGVYSAIQYAAAGKQDRQTFDSAPQANSTNPVTSGGIKTALDAKVSQVNNMSPTNGSLTLSLDNQTFPNQIEGNAPTANSTKLITSGAVAGALQNCMPVMTVDSAPQAGNFYNLVSSNGVYAAIEAKIPTVISSVDDSSNNPVQSRAIAYAIQQKQIRGTAVTIAVSNWLQEENGGDFIYRMNNAIAPVQAITSKTCVIAYMADEESADNLVTGILITPDATNNKIVFSTQTVPKGTISINVMLQESAGVGGPIYIRCGTGGGDNPFDTHGEFIVDDSVQENATILTNVIAKHGSYAVAAFEAKFDSKSVTSFATFPDGLVPFVATSAYGTVWSGSTVTQPAELSLTTVNSVKFTTARTCDHIKFAALYDARVVGVGEFTYSLWNGSQNQHDRLNVTVNEITKDTVNGTLRLRFAAEMTSGSTALSNLILTIPDDQVYIFSNGSHRTFNVNVRTSNNVQTTKQVRLASPDYNRISSNYYADTTAFFNVDFDITLPME